MRLSNTLEPEFCVAALDEALARYGKPEIFTGKPEIFTAFSALRLTRKLPERNRYQHRPSH